MLAVNTWNEPREAVAQFVQQHSLRQKVLLNGSGLDEALGRVGVPTVLWIDKEGVVRDVLWGLGSRSTIERKTRKLLSRG